MYFRTQKFDKFVSPAQPKSQFWRLAAGVITIAAIFLGFTIGTMTLAQKLGFLVFSETTMDMNTRDSMSLMFLTFIGMIIGVWLSVKLYHGRPLNSLFGEWTAVRKNFLFSLFVTFSVQLPFMVIAMLVWGIQPNLSFASVALFLPISFLLLLIQTGAEELVFRGYLTQQLAARFKSPIIWFALPALLFGILHYDPQGMGQMAVWIAAALTILGFLLADLTRVTGNLGAAWGWHFSNNFLLMNLVGMPDNMHGYSWKIFTFSYHDLSPIVNVPIIGMDIVIWLILRTKLAQY